MSSVTYGYIRVSSKDQNEDRQRIAMREANMDDRHIYMDKQSGKDFERSAFKRVIKKSSRATPLLSRALTGLAATMTRYWNSGALSQRKSVPQSLCWICRSWIPTKDVT